MHEQHDAGPTPTGPARGRRHLTAAAAAVVALVALGAGCAGSDEDTDAATAPDLRIEEQVWVGVEGAQPAPVIGVHAATEGAEIPLDDSSGDTVLRVVRVEGDQVDIAVDGVAPVHAGGGIDMNACGDQELTVTVGEPVEFATCTLDAGVVWTVTAEPG